MFIMPVKNVSVILTSVLSAIILSVPCHLRSESTNDVIRENFLNPPQPAGPQSYWFWVDGNFSKEGITKDLEAMKASGFGGALILNVGGGAPSNPQWSDHTYHGEKFFDAIRHAAAEAKRLGMTIGLANAPGYDGTGGPWVPEKENMRHLVWVRRDCAGPASLDLKLPKPQSPESGYVPSKKEKLSTIYDDIAVLAVPEGKTVRFDQITNITTLMKPDGSLKWEVPPGKWSVYRIGYTPTMVGPHPAPLGAEHSLEVDKMDKEANVRHWNNVIDPLKKSLGDLYGDSFNRLHIDSYECGAQNWTRNFREEFIKRKGYDPVPWLAGFGTPVLGFKPGQFNGGIMSGKPRGEDSRLVGNEELSRRFDWDFADVVNRLFTDNWILAKSMMASNNVKFSFEPYSGPFSTIEGAAIADIPMATFWTTTSCSPFKEMNGAGKISQETAGAARAAGHTVLNCESFTSMPTVSMWTEKPALLKYIADGAFCNGVNQMTLHHWTHQPYDDRYQPGMTFFKWGVHFGRFQTWFEPGKAFFQYLARCQAMLQQGEEVVDALCIDSFPSDKSHADLISSHDFLKDDTKVVDGKVRLSSGRTYRYISYPSNGVVLPEVAAKLKDLLDQGARLVTGRFSKSPSLADYPACDRKVGEIGREIWDSGKYADRVFADEASVADRLGLKPDYTIVSPTAPESVQVVHRRSPDADIYFVANRTDKHINPLLDFRISGKKPELWQAEDSSVQDAAVWSEKDGRTTLPLSLRPHQAIFVVFRKAGDQADHPVAVNVNGGSDQWSLGRDKAGNPVIRSSDQVSAKVTYVSGREKTVTTQPISPIETKGPWKVSFAPKLGDAFQLDFPELVDFSSHEDARVKYFAGTATYSKDITLTEKDLAPGRRVLLDLGTMNDIASVRVNGGKSTVVWYAPYELDITDLVKPGNNLVEIAVTVNWANALIGDEQIPPDFTPSKYPDWFLEKKPRPSARKTFTTWNYFNKESKLYPAGLVGPVKVRFEDQKSF